MDALTPVPDAAPPLEDASRPEDSAWMEDAPMSADAHVDARAPVDASPPPDARETGDGCAPRAAESSLRGTTCAPTAATCPPGYECEGFSGVVVSYSCQIPCTMHCECPSGLFCQPWFDKAGRHTHCGPPE